MKHRIDRIVDKTYDSELNKYVLFYLSKTDGKYDFRKEYYDKLEDLSNAKEGQIIED